MKNIFLYIAAVSLIVSGWGCKRLVNPFGGEKSLARSGEHSLYIEDIQSIFTPGLSPQDSLQLLEAYVDMWVKKQLKVQEAEKLLSDSQSDIDRMVEDYRNSLLSIRLDQYFIDRLLDTTITDRQVEDYYAAHRSDFTLDRTVVRGEIVRLPAGYRQVSRLKELMASSKPNDRQDFLDLGLKNNFTHREFTQWADVSEFLAQLPPSRPRAEEIVRKTGVQELVSGSDRYLYRIGEYRVAGDPSPIQRVNAVIRRAILNQRKNEIVRRYEDSIYNAAVRDKRIVVKVK